MSGTKGWSRLVPRDGHDWYPGMAVANTRDGGGWYPRIEVACNQRIICDWYPRMACTKVWWWLTSVVEMTSTQGWVDWYPRMAVTGIRDGGNWCLGIELDGTSDGAD